MTDATVTNIRSQDGVSAPEMLERIPGLTYRQLDYWTRAGRIQALPGRSGSGNYRRYSEQQAALTARLHRLVVYGFTLNAAEQLAKDRRFVLDAISMLTAIYSELFAMEDKTRPHTHAQGSEQDYKAQPDGDGA
jgi:DNA-binding transcriptional MerR regulator